MKIGIMQPYLFPYLGYFQLIYSVDKYVILDDVQYIKGGWINRNKILLNSSPKPFTLPVKYAPHSLNINERYFADSFQKDKKKFLNIVRQSYSKSPYYNKAFPLLEKILNFKSRNVASYTINGLQRISEFMGINTPFIISSNMERNRKLKRENMVVDIVKRLGGSMYINAIGGQVLYTKEFFLKNSINLKFIKMSELVYEQYGNSFVPGLSIIDVLMFNNKREINKLLNEYELV